MIITPSRRDPTKTFNEDGNLKKKTLRRLTRIERARNHSDEETARNIDRYFLGARA